MVRILIDGPGKNSLGTPMMVRLRDAFAAAGGAPVLLTGGGDVFSAGLDLKEVASLERGAMSAFLRGFEALVKQIHEYPAPVVALVNGHAIAGGAVLARAADFAIATDSPKARIGLNEVAIGLQFPPYTLAMLKNRIPSAHWTRALLEAGLFDPTTAAGLGLVDRAAPDAEAAAMELVERLGKLPAAAYGALKRELRRIDVPDSEMVRFEADVVPVWTSESLREQIRAVLGARRT